MSKKQIVYVSLFSLIMTMLIWPFITSYPLLFFRALLFFAGILALFISIFFIAAIVVTRGSILPNPYRIPIIVIKKQKEMKE